MNYPNPFIPQRADPYVVKGPDGKYYFTASYPAFMNVDAWLDAEFEGGRHQQRIDKIHALED